MKSETVLKKAQKSASEKSVSLGTKAWRRLLKNKPAVFGMIVIGFAALIAIFCYAVAPDSTPDGNDQILQLETHPPGFSTQILKVEKNQKFENQNFISKLVNGSRSTYVPVPINGYRFEGNEIVVEVYRGLYLPAEEARYSMVDVAYNLSYKSPEPRFVNETAIFYDIEEKEQQIAVEDLKQKIEKEKIIERTYLLGTDKFGRDVLSRITIGVRVSLSVGIVSVIISLVIGILLGALAGYFRGKVDDVILWLINVFWSIPTLLLAMGLTISVGSHFLLIYVAVGLTMWVEMARIVRGQFLGIREVEFVEAAQSLGFNHFRTIFLHILPNIMGPVIVIAAVNFATAILIEAGLSFIGLGVQPPKPSWGTMMKEYWSFIGTSKGYLAIFPGLAVMLLVLAFNLIGNGLRDAMDVKTNI